MIVIEREDGTKITIQAPSHEFDGLVEPEVQPEYPTAKSLIDGLDRVSALTYTPMERYEDGRW